MLSVLQNFVLPGYISEVSDTATTEHMMQLFDSTAKLDMVPGYVNKITVNGESRKLTGNEIFAYKTLRGEHYSEIIPLLTSAEWYNALEDDMKVSVLTSFKELVDADCKHMIDTEYYPNNKRMISVIDGGFNADDVMTYLQGEMIKLSVDSDKDVDKLKAVLEMDLSDDEIMGAVGVIYDGSQMEKLDAAVKNGVNVKDYVKLQATALEIDAEGKFGSANGSVDTDELEAAIDKMRGLSVKEKAVLYQTYNKNTNPASNPYDVDTAYKLVIDIGWDMDNSKEIRKIVASSSDDGAKLKKLQPLMENEMFEITEGASKNGIPVKTAFDVIQKFDKDYSIYGYKSDDERDALKQTAKSKTGLGISQYYGKLAVDSVSGLSIAQKAILWQCCDPSWSHKNNPYSPNIGAKYRSEMGWDK